MKKTEEGESKPLMVTVSFTDGTRSQSIPLPAGCGNTLPETVTVHSVPPRHYVRVFGTLYAPKKQDDD